MHVESNLYYSQIIYSDVQISAKYNRPQENGFENNLLFPVSILSAVDCIS